MSVIPSQSLRRERIRPSVAIDSSELPLSMIIFFVRTAFAVLLPSHCFPVKVKFYILVCHPLDKALESAVELTMYIRYLRL